MLSHSHSNKEGHQLFITFAPVKCVSAVQVLPPATVTCNVEWWTTANY